MTSEFVAITSCDCLTDCGDDERIRKGTVKPCAQYRKAHNIMDTYEEGMELITQQKKKVDEAIKELTRLKHEMCRKFSGVNIGDTVECNGWSYKGKCMDVERIDFSPETERFIAVGKVLRSDGSVGANRGERNWQHPDAEK